MTLFGILTNYLHLWVVKKSKLSAIGQLFELKQLPSEKRKQLYEKFLKKYTKLEKKNPLKEIRAEIWRQTKDKEILARFAMLTSKISVTARLKDGSTEIDVYNSIEKLVKNKKFVKGLGKKGNPIEKNVINDLRKAVSDHTSSWKGPQGSHTGGARARAWLENMANFIEKNDYDLLKWLESFDCPSKAVSVLKKIKFSSRDSAKFLALVGHPKLNEPDIPVCVSKWYPKHAKCFPPRINDEVAKFFLRTGCITIKSTEEYYDIPEKGFDTKTKEFVGVSYPIFYGIIFDELKKTKDPSLFAERIISFCSDSFDGICTDEEPNCKNCVINDICQLSKSKGKNPEIVQATPSNTDFYSGRTKPNTSSGCLVK